MESSLTQLELALRIYGILIDTRDSVLCNVHDLADKEGSNFAVELVGLLGNKAIGKKRDVEFIHVVSVRALRIVTAKQFDNSLRDIAP